MELTPETVKTSDPAVEIAILAAVADAVATAKEEGSEKHLCNIFALADEVSALKAAARLARVMTPSCPPLRAARLWACAHEGVELADLRWAVGATKSGVGQVHIGTRYAGLSRGKCYGRHTDGGWAPKDGSTVHLDRAGKWTVGSSDGFNRKEKATWTVRNVGAYLFAV